MTTVDLRFFGQSVARRSDGFPTWRRGRQPCVLDESSRGLVSSSDKGFLPDGIEMTC